MTDTTKRIYAFLIYTCFMQGVLWIPVSIAVFWHDFNGWWMAMPICLSGFQWKPARFGITTPGANDE